MHILDCAVRFDMTKLLACCEYHISVDTQQRFQPVSLRLGHVLSASSMSQIAEGLHTAFFGITVDLLPNARHYITISESLHQQGKRRRIVINFVPGPEKFYKMPRRLPESWTQLLLRTAAAGCSH